MLHGAQLDNKKTVGNLRWVACYSESIVSSMTSVLIAQYNTTNIDLVVEKVPEFLVIFAHNLIHLLLRQSKNGAF